MTFRYQAGKSYTWHYSLFQFLEYTAVCLCTVVVAEGNAG